MRIFLSLLLSLVLALSLRGICLREKAASPRMTQCRYKAYIAPLLLPFYCIYLPVIALTYGREAFVHILLTLYFESFIHLCVYYLLLLALFPLLRKRYAARTCAAFWLIPNCIYFIGICMDPLSSPMLVLTTPPWLIKALLVLWLLGFVLIMAVKCISHIRFRKTVLNDAIPVTDPHILDMFRWELVDARIETRKYKLAYSAHIASPLSIGFFQRSTWILLPQKEYSLGELELIFRHEIIHICRWDSAYKFFMTFCTAICWFNPLMWVAMKRSAEDLELSCDETVLLRMEDEKKSKYAELILETAEDQRGFTTCLSASAESLKYRLRSILKPAPRKNGYFLLGLVFFLFSCTYGSVALAYDTAPGTEILFQGAPEDFSYDSHFSDAPYAYTSISTDSDALTAYISSLNFSTITGFYHHLYYGGTQHWLRYNGPEGELVIMLEKNRAIVTYPTGEEASSQAYYVQDIDWDYLNTLFEYRTD